MENGWKPSKRYLTAYKGLYGAQLELAEAKVLGKPKAAPRPRGCPDEDYEHMACVNWLNREGLRCHHSPNGGKRDWHTGAKLKAMGTSAGLAEQKIVAPVAAKPAVQQRRPRNPGWCVAELPEGQNLQNVPRDQILASAAAHEAKWKGRFNEQQRASQASMNWSRG